jgi:hypothetical protein
MRNTSKMSLRNTAILLSLIALSACGKPAAPAVDPVPAPVDASTGDTSTGDAPQTDLPIEPVAGPEAAPVVSTPSDGTAPTTSLPSTVPVSTQTVPITVTLSK